MLLTLQISPEDLREIIRTAITNRVNQIGRAENLEINFHDSRSGGHYPLEKLDFLSLVAHQKV